MADSIVTPERIVFMVNRGSYIVFSRYNKLTFSSFTPKSLRWHMKLLKAQESEGDPRLQTLSLSDAPYSKHLKP